jgi:hypothetical protein
MHDVQLTYPDSLPSMASRELRNHHNYYCVHSMMHIATTLSSYVLFIYSAKACLRGKTRFCHLDGVGPQCFIQSHYFLTKNRQLCCALLLFLYTIILCCATTKLYFYMAHLKWPCSPVRVHHGGQI